MKKIIQTVFPFRGRLKERYAALEAKKHELEQVISRYSLTRDIVEELHAQLLALTQQHAMPEKGTKEWLEVMEFKYGGTVKNLYRRKVSDKDPRTRQQLSNGGMIGGDRMSRIEHNYAPVYEECLRPYLHKENKKLVIAEVGILKGTGLALWSDLFEHARILGFDIDLSHVHENMPDLIARGAFKSNNLELYEFDQYADNRGLVETILQGDSLDIIIDDGLHFDETIMKTIESLRPFFADDFLYIIEDNSTVYSKLRSVYGDYAIENIGKITIIRNRLSVHEKA